MSSVYGKGRSRSVYECVSCGFVGGEWLRGINGLHFTVIKVFTFTFPCETTQGGVTGGRVIWWRRKSPLS